MAVGIRITLNDGLYLKDPQQTELGQRIIQHSILLIDELGIECFTFKKLAEAMGSTEASVYRYFENKHMLLVYLVSWYWEWVNYLLDVNTMNMTDPKDRLKKVIHTIVFAAQENPSIDYVNESVLHRIVISEGSKAYHIKSVDQENREGFFTNYGDLTAKISDFILDVNPTFKYPRAMASNLFEMANNHIYFAEHLPRLTDISVQNDDFSEVEEMLEHFVFGLVCDPVQA